MTLYDQARLLAALALFVAATGLLFALIDLAIDHVQDQDS